jgi:hypothetical protein
MRQCAGYKSVTVGAPSSSAAPGSAIFGADTRDLLPHISISSVTFIRGQRIVRRFFDLSLILMTRTGLGKRLRSGLKLTSNVPQLPLSLQVQLKGHPPFEIGRDSLSLMVKSDLSTVNPITACSHPTGVRISG